MKINSLRSSLLRARNLRSAKRSRVGKVLSSRTSGTRSSSSSTSTKRTTSSSLSTTKSKQLTMYEKMEKSASDIQQNVEMMIAIGKMSYTDDETGKKAQENDKEKLIKDIKDFISDYNVVSGNLSDIGGVANLALKKTLDSVVSASENELKEIGITVSKSGELSIDEKKLTAADYEKVKDLFAEDGSFAEKISVKMGAIENAAANSLNTLSKLYGATSTYDKYGTSNSYYNSSYYNNYNYSNSSSWYF